MARRKEKSVKDGGYPSFFIFVIDSILKEVYNINIKTEMEEIL